MNAIDEQIESLRAWSQPREASHRGRVCPFKLICILAEGGADECDLPEVATDTGLRAFWKKVRWAELFKDEQFEQWGVRILTPVDARSETAYWQATRPKDFLKDDLVIGQFIGDSEILVVEGATRGAECRVLVGMPLDRREDWPTAGNSFATFLKLLIEYQGDKFWELEPSRGLD